MKTPSNETIEVKRGNFVALIRPTIDGKTGKTFFVTDYRINGKRHQVWRAKLADARAVANDALNKIANGEAAVLDLKSADANFYLRAVEYLKPTGQPVDIAAREYAECWGILGGKAGLVEVCRDWARRNLAIRGKISVADAVEKVYQACIAENKSEPRCHELQILLNRFARDINCNVDAITPAIVSLFLSGLDLSERSKRNYQDAIKHLNKWCVLHQYLPKGTDWCEGVQKYSARKVGEICIYSPDEMRTILNHVKGWCLPVIAIGAFSALRSSEIYRLDWAQVELSDKAGESFITVLDGKNARHGYARRLVPISANLGAWLKPIAQKSGRICPLEFANRPEKRLVAVIKAAGVTFKKNALRHSGISYKIAASNDVAKVADESGNSPQVIRTNYLRRVKPSQAAEWFGIMPETKPAELAEKITA